jgi:hypothetical protein
VRLFANEGKTKREILVIVGLNNNIAPLGRHEDVASPTTRDRRRELLHPPAPQELTHPRPACSTWSQQGLLHPPPGTRRQGRGRQCQGLLHPPDSSTVSYEGVCCRNWNLDADIIANVQKEFAIFPYTVAVKPVLQIFSLNWMVHLCHWIIWKKLLLFCWFCWWSSILRGSWETKLWCIT